MQLRRVLVYILTSLVLGAFQEIVALHGQVPGLINYQGRISSGGTNFTGSAEFKFALVNSNGSLSFWSNDGSSTGGGEPVNSVALGVTNGLYSLLLGNTALANMTVVPASVFTNTDVRLRVWFRNTLSPFQLLSPDQRIAAVGYAMNAGTLGGQSASSFLATTGGVLSGSVSGTSFSGSFTGGFTGNGTALTNLNASALTSGIIGNNRIGTGVITADRLVKPPQSGSIDSASLVFCFGQADFSVAFAPAFATTPNVTLGLETANATLARTLFTSLTSKSTTDFAGVIQTLVPASVAADTNGDTGHYASLQVVNGSPAIAYFEGSNGDLRFVRANNTIGSIWGSPVSVDTNGLTGHYPSLKIVNGSPAIAYQDASNGDLKFVRASNANGSTWGTPVSVDTNSDTGYYPSLEIVNGSPAIAYQDSGNGDLKFVRASNTNGTTWDTPVSVDTNGFTGLYPSLKIVSGSPAIAYQDGSNTDLRFVRASNTNGTTWDTPVSVDTNGSTGWFPSFEIVNSSPAIAYQDGGNGDLRFVRASHTNGTTWDTPVSVDTNGFTGLYPSLRIVNGSPAIAYQDGSNTDLRFVRASTINGSTWGTPVAVDTNGSTGWFSSLQIVSGGPAIAYLDSSNGDLKFVRGGTNAPAPFRLNWIGLEP